MGLTALLSDLGRCARYDFAIDLAGYVIVGLCISRATIHMGRAYQPK